MTPTFIALVHADQRPETKRGGRVLLTPARFVRRRANGGGAF